MNVIHIVNYNTERANDGTIDPSLVKGTGDAYPTSRVLEGSSDHGYAEEWAEPAMLPDGTECYRMYLFTDDDVVGEDGEPLEPDMLPWDDEHVARIKIA